MNILRDTYRLSFNHKILINACILVGCVCVRYLYMLSKITIIGLPLLIYAILYSVINKDIFNYLLHLFKKYFFIFLLYEYKNRIRNTHVYCY